MSLQFILGGSGSGKSEYLYRLVTEKAGENPKKNYLVIVPEQFTLATQQKLVSLSPNQAIMNVDVLSFKRLAYRVFDDMGKSDISVLEETGKNLLIRRIAQEQDDKLTVLRHNMSRMGYVDQMKSLISEFVQYNVTPEKLHELLENNHLSRSFNAKLSDVTLLYEYFLESMKDHYYMAEEVLNVLAELAPQSELLKDSVLVFDEFTGFTPIQYDLMRSLLPVTDKIYVSLTIDPNQVGSMSTGTEDLFDMSKVTIDRLKKLAISLHVDIDDDLVMESTKDRRFINAPSLFHLESHLFRPYYKRFIGQPEEIKLVNAGTPREEVVNVAREINRIIRENNYRYRDIAVVTGDLNTYSIYTKEVFARYKVPFFLDSTKEVEFSPFIECIKSILEIIDSGFSYESIMRFLRTGFTDIALEDIDILDNYLLATGISYQSQWERTWLGRKAKADTFDLTALEELRLQIVNLLAPMRSLSKKEKATISDAIIALYKIMNDLNAAEKLQNLSAKYIDLELETKAKEFEQVYDKVMLLLEKYYELLGDEEYTITTFTELLEAGLSAIKLAATPPGFDSVVVGDIERTRLNGPKIMFFVGINEGVIPKSANTGGIISEYERQSLLESGMEIAPGVREKAFIQRYYLYRNLTKPSNLLYLSYARSGNDGTKLQPSYLVNTIKKLFPDLKDQALLNVAGEKDYSSKAVAMEYLAQSQQDDDWYATAKALEDEEAVASIVKAPFVRYQDSNISKNVARVIYGDDFYGSITQIESFYNCAYKHFLQYGIRLKEREEAGLSNLDIGNLYHSALEIAGKRISKENSWSTITDEERDVIADEAMNQALLSMTHTEFVNENMAETYHLKRMKEIFSRNLWVIVNQIKKGQFRPEYFEFKFGSNEKAKLEYSLSSGKLMNLKGKIDRIDTYKNEKGKIYVKIVDYKTSKASTEFKMDKLYFGLQLQLAVYLNAAVKELQEKHPVKEIVPGALFYQLIDDPVVEANKSYMDMLVPDGRLVKEDELCYALDKNLEGSSYTSDVVPISVNKTPGQISSSNKLIDMEQMNLMSNYAIYKMTDGGAQIYDGKVTVSPFEGGDKGTCSRCSFKGVCGFDSKIPGYEYQNKKVKASDVFDRMETELALNSWSGEDSK